MLPENAPEAWSDRERLWNDVEAFEVRKDAQLAREVEFALPREMTQAQGIELARDFVRGEFVDRGMIADLNVHWDMAEDGIPKPHAHVMLTMRAVDENGFGQKVRDWNRTEMVARWRERWAELANERLAELDIDARIDHRSLEAQGIALEPQSQIGAPAKRIENRVIESEGTEADRAEMHREIARGNGARIIADPSLALDAITHQQSTFTSRDMAKFAHRHSDGIDQFNEVMGAMRGAPDLVELGRDARGEDRFTTRQMIEAEQRLHRAAELMAERERHEVNDRHRQAALAHGERAALSFPASRPTRWRMSRTGAIFRSWSAMPEPARAPCWAWRGGHGRRRVMRFAVSLFPASLRKISKADRALRPAPSPAWNMAGDRAAICSLRATFW